MSTELRWKVKPSRFVRDRKGRIVAIPGDTLPYDDKNALACPSAVVSVWAEVQGSEPEPEPEPEPPIVTDWPVDDGAEPEDEE